MVDKQEAIKRLREMYPKPRVGQRLKTRKGKLLEVVIVRSAREVLKGMREEQAIMVGPRMQALYGKHWVDVYFEAECVAVGSPQVVTVSPMDIAEIFDAE